MNPLCVLELFGKEVEPFTTPPGGSTDVVNFEFWAFLTNQSSCCTHSMLFSEKEATLNSQQQDSKMRSN